MPHTTDVIEAIEAGDPSRVEDLVAADPALADARDDAGVSALMIALYRRQDRSVTALRAARRELDIFEAAAVGDVNHVESILGADAGAAVAFSADGFTALHFAAFFSQAACALLLLHHGADISAVARNAMRVMPLHSAVAARASDVAVLLLEHGAPPNAAQRGGWTPLQAAAQHGDETLVGTLLAAGADPRQAADDGRTAADMAEQAGHVALAQWIRAGDAVTKGP